MKTYSHYKRHISQFVNTDTSHLDPKVRATYALAQLRARQMFEEDEVIKNLREGLGL